MSVHLWYPFVQWVAEYTPVQIGVKSFSGEVLLVLRIVVFCDRSFGRYRLIGAYVYGNRCISSTKNSKGGIGKAQSGPSELPQAARLLNLGGLILGHLLPEGGPVGNVDGG
jgi:hypothetical protein